MGRVTITYGNESLHKIRVTINEIVEANSKRHVEYCDILNKISYMKCNGCLGYHVNNGYLASMSIFVEADCVDDAKQIVTKALAENLT